MRLGWLFGFRLSAFGFPAFWLLAFGFWLFVGASLLANGASRICRCSGATPPPLPNPLPEGRGDRWAGLGILALAGNTEGLWWFNFLGHLDRWKIH
ncbi:hypothetical protein PCLA_04f0382 [Pseudomonas citronellolis]|nr:hypothetical protein PCLA_04f0382 [Pseudomonas citronellolis]